MLPSARWLLLAAALAIAAGAVGFALPRWLDPDPDSRPAGSVDWAAVLDAVSDDGFARPTGPWQLALPADHGAHPEARLETWTVSAHLRAHGREEIAVQFALLRIGIVAPDAPEQASPWGLRAVYRGHVVLLEAPGDGVKAEERLHRDLPGLVGHDPAHREVRLDDWILGYGEGEAGERLRLDATVGAAELELVLAPAKAAVAVNPAGDGPPFRGYAMTRLRAEGFIGGELGRQAVAGLAWLEHVWGNVPLPLGPIVADRLQLQLDDGTDLSVTRTRRRDGGGTPTLAAFLVDPGGRAEVLAAPPLEMQVTRSWSDEAVGPYPLAWRLRAAGLRLDVLPVIDDQVLQFAVPVWSGAVAGQGTLRDRPVSGRGTLLLTGGIR